jgi:hypothetical protein
MRYYVTGEQLHHTITLRKGPSAMPDADITPPICDVAVSDGLYLLGSRSELLRV